MSRKSPHKNKEALYPFYHKNHFRIAKNVAKFHRKIHLIKFFFINLQAPFHKALSPLYHKNHF